MSATDRIEPNEADVLPAFRPPAVPLVTHDPYFSVWSPSDNLTGAETCHWTGTPHPLCGMLRVDGTAYRFAGPSPADVPAMTQARLEVLPTRTIYRFDAGGVRLMLTFLSPLLAGDLDVLGRPVTYVTFTVRATDGLHHDVSVYFDCAAALAVNTADQEVAWSRQQVDDLDVLSVGTVEQPVLAKKGDNLRGDWGHLYLAATRASAATVIGGAEACRRAFADVGGLPEGDDDRMPRRADDDCPVLACVAPIGRIGTRLVSRHVMLAYDDEYSIEYLGQRLRPWWRRTGAGAADLLRLGAQDYERLSDQCATFDRELSADLRRVGGEKFERLAALAYRECLAAHKLAAGPDGQPMFFSKENFSNGCIATVDVTYPSAPLLLLTNPALLRALVEPVMAYAASPRWKFPFAPHDLGTYPLANGQVYGGGEDTEENQMPVEESGNMLLLLTALARIEGSPAYALRYWPQVTAWAQYLREKGLDPANQLCTDDFAGHLAHNANLSLKAILALGGYAELCHMAGSDDAADEYRAIAERMAADWVCMADDEDHYRLAFDKPGTWSQKYNLVWDQLLGICLFPAQVARKEMEFYRAHLNRYGLPLDSRQPYAKLDWVVWTATLTGDRADFEALIAPVYDFACETPDRVPLTDWFWTTDGRKAGFQARSVVGGVFLPMLGDRKVWRKWADRARR